MVDYGKLIEEEKARQNSAIAAANARREREVDLIAFFRNVEIELGLEMAKANVELKKRGAPAITGPFRPVKGEETIELAFGTRAPRCKLSLLTTSAHVGLAEIVVELLDETGVFIGRKKYVIEGESKELKAYQSLVEGFPDRSAEAASSTIAQEIVSGIIRGRFV